MIENNNGKSCFFLSKTEKRVRQLDKVDIKHLQEEGQSLLTALVVSQPREATVIDINGLFKERYQVLQSTPNFPPFLTQKGSGR